MKIKNENYGLDIQGLREAENGGMREGANDALDLLEFSMKEQKIKTLLISNSFWDAATKILDKPQNVQEELLQRLPSGLYHILAPLNIHFVLYYSAEGECINIWHFYQNKFVECSYCDSQNGTGTYCQTEDIVDNTMQILAFVLFYHFAEVETLVLNKSKKRGHLADCKYINELNEDVIVLDSSWFTNLIKSEGFNVRGHFAIRAFGNGRKDRRLVWINNYEKSGYHRTAGIIKNNE